MTYSSEITQSQVKNLKRRLVSFIWEATPKRVIELALICGVKIHKNLVDKYTSEG
jgi:hypothetical protein